ncbi:MAG: hypothetical protein AB7G39_10045 [Alphaproteobacteria bacterium]
MQADRLRRAVRLAVALTLAIYAAALIQHPKYNWDVIGYTAAALSWAGLEGPALHAETFERVRAFVPARPFKELTEPDWEYGYRRAVYADPEALRQQVPWYSVKPAFVALAAAVAALGPGLPAAAHLVSAAGGIGALIVLALWARRRLSVAAATLVCLAAVLSGLHEAARLPTPDALSILCILAGCWLFAAGRGHTALAVLTGAIAIRPDNVLFLGLFALYAAVAAPAPFRLSRVAAAAAILGGGTLYLTVKAATGYYGQTTILVHGFIGALPYPATTPVAFGLDEYREVMAYRLPQAMRSDLDEVLRAVLGLALPLLTRRLDATVRMHAGLAAVAAAYVVLHFLLLPDLSVRFFAGQYAIIWLAAALALTAAMPEGRVRRLLSAQDFRLGR